LIIIKFACDQPVGDLMLSAEHDLYRWVHLDELDEGEYPEWMKEEIRRAYRIYTDFRGL
jgi:8-oxo-dGTP diphosphatase